MNSNEMSKRSKWNRRQRKKHTTVDGDNVGGSDNERLVNVLLESLEKELKADTETDVSVAEVSHLMACEDVVIEDGEGDEESSGADEVVDTEMEKDEQGNEEGVVDGECEEWIENATGDHEEETEPESDHYDLAEDEALIKSTSPTHEGNKNNRNTDKLDKVKCNMFSKTYLCTCAFIGGFLLVFTLYYTYNTLPFHLYFNDEPIEKQEL